MVRIATSLYCGGSRAFKYKFVFMPDQAFSKPVSLGHRSDSLDIPEGTPLQTSHLPPPVFPSGRMPNGLSQKPLKIPSPPGKEQSRTCTENAATAFHLRVVLIVVPYQMFMPSTSQVYMIHESTASLKAAL